MALLRPRVDGFQGDASTRQTSPPQSKFSAGKTKTEAVVGSVGPEQQHGTGSMKTTCPDSHREQVMDKLCQSPKGSTSAETTGTAVNAKNPGPTHREPVVLGSQEYEERRRKRAARGMATLRQLSQEFDRIDTL